MKTSTTLDIKGTNRELDDIDEKRETNMKQKERTTARKRKFKDRSREKGVGEKETTEEKRKVGDMEENE